MKCFYRHREILHFESDQYSDAEVWTHCSTSGSNKERPSGASSCVCSERYMNQSSDFRGVCIGSIFNVKTFIITFTSRSSETKLCCRGLNVSVSGSSSELLDMYFETSWAPPEDVIMIPDEQAAVVTFSDPEGF